MSAAGCLAELCRWWLLLALLLAAAGKSVAFARFRRDLAASFPELGRAAGTIAVLVVALEAGLAVAIAGGGAAARYGCAAAAVTFGALGAVVAVALAQDRTVVCSCFGGASHPMSRYDLVRNGLLIVAAMVAALVPPAPGLGVAAHVALIGLASIALQLTLGLRDVVGLLRMRS